MITQVQTVVDVIGSLEKHVARQHSENREATASASVKEEHNEEELNFEELSAGGDDLAQPNNDITGDDGNVSPVLASIADDDKTNVSELAEDRTQRAFDSAPAPRAEIHYTMSDTTGENVIDDGPQFTRIMITFVYCYMYATTALHYH